MSHIRVRICPSGCAGWLNLDNLELLQQLGVIPPQARPRRKLEANPAPTHTTHGLYRDDTACFVFAYTVGLKRCFANGAAEGLH